MKYLTIVLIMGFISIAVFGVFAMNHGNGHSHSGCIAASLAGGACPEGEATSFLSFHLGALKSFSTVTIVLSVLTFLTLFLFALGELFLAREQNSIILRRNSFYSEHDASSAFQRQLNHWLAFHENSPSLV